MVELFPVKTIKSISELLNAVSDYKTRNPAEWLFYRGQNCASWKLQPRVKRPPFNEASEQIMTNRFCSEAVGRHNNCPPAKAYAHWLVLMQHYGLPTRLLDWTSSPLIGAFFAVAYGAEKDARHGDGCIWLLNPVRLNTTYMSVADTVIDLNNEYVEPIVHGAFASGDIRRSALEFEALHISPDERTNRLNQFDRHEKRLEGFILATHAPHLDPRVMAQSGYFTIHNTDQPLDEVGASGRYLEKWIIPAQQKEKVASELRDLGIRLANVFPDLTGLAQDLREETERQLIADGI